VDVAFSSLTTNTPPTPTAVQVISDVVTKVVEAWLNAENVPTATFNPISTPFVANGTGVDHVLDYVNVDTSTGRVTVTDGTTTQQSTVTYTTIDGSMAVSTTTSGTDGTSSSESGTVVPVQTTQQTVLDAITSTCDSFAQVVNAKGASLSVSDLQPFVDSNALWGGISGAQYTGLLVWALGGKTVSFSGTEIESLDTTGSQAAVVLSMSQTQNGLVNVQPQEFLFKKVNGSWVLEGDQRIAQLEVRADTSTSEGAQMNPPILFLEVHVAAPHGTLASVEVSGGPWTAQAVPLASTDPAPWDSTLTMDAFETNTQTPTSLSAGTTFTFTVTPTSGSPVQYTLPLNAITTEAITLSGPTGGSLATDGHPGTAVPVTWNLPKTYAIAYQRVGTVAYSSNGKCDDMGEVTIVSATSTSATPTIPTTCGGAQTPSAEIYVQAYGVNGELSMGYWQFQ